MRSRSRLAHDAEQLGALLDELEQAAVRVELLGAHLAEQVGGAADVQALLRGDELGERGPKRSEEGTLARRQPGIVEAAAQERRPELEAGHRLVEVLARPLREPGIDRIVEVEEPLRHAARGGDHHDHHELRLQEQHLDVHDRRRLERRRGHEREQPRHLREHLRRRLQRRLDLAARRVQVERELGRLRREPVQQLVGVVAVAALGRHAAGGGVRMRQQAERLELGELGAHGRRRRGEPAALDERLRADGLATGNVRLDDAAQDFLLARTQLQLHAHLQQL